MNIYVGNLALDMTEDVLRQEFILFGQVTSISIMNDKYIGSGQPRGYGFIEMPSNSEGQAAIIGLNGKILGNRALSVIKALPLSPNKGTGSFNSRSGGRFHGQGRQRRFKIS